MNDPLALFVSDIAAPCEYEGAHGFTCLEDHGGESWSGTLDAMRARARGAPLVTHVPCRPCEARLQLQCGPWGNGGEWNGRASR